MKKLFTFLAILFATWNIAGATNILGTPQISTDQMYQFVKSKNPGWSFSYEIAKQYHDQGVKWGIRGDVALAQACVETGWFRYTGGTAVTPDDHNYCGLGVTTLGYKGCQFGSIATGVSAHLQHLWAYATTAGLPSGWTLVDPRFNYVRRGCATTFENLGYGHWAAAGGYGSSIMSIYNEMKNFKMANPKLTASETTFTITAKKGEASPTKTVTITAENLATPIKMVANATILKYATASGWDEYKGGKLNVSVDMTKNAGTYNGGYIRLYSGDLEVRLNITVVIQPEGSSGGDDPDPTEKGVYVNPESLSFTVEQNSTAAAKTLKVTGVNLEKDIDFVSYTKYVTVASAAGWNARTGGTLNVTVDTSRDPGTYTGGYVAVQSTTAYRKEIPVTVTITEKVAPPVVDPVISVYPETISFDVVQGEKSSAQTVKVIAENLPQDLSVAASTSDLTVTKGSDWNARTGGTLNVTLTSSRAAGTYDGYVAVVSGSLRKQVNVKYVVSAPEVVDPEFPALDFKVAETEGSSIYRNMVYNDGKLYLSASGSSVVVKDARTLKTIKTLSNGSVVAGGTYAVCGVAVLNGKVYAANMVTSAAHKFRVYRWDSDDAQPVLVTEVASHDEFVRLGDAISVSGTDAAPVITMLQNNASGNACVVEYTVSGGNATLSSKVVKKADGTVLGATTSGRARRIASGGYEIDDQNRFPSVLDPDGKVVGQLGNETVFQGNDFATFRYNGSNYMLAISYLNKSAASIADGVMRLYDVTEGWEKAVAKGDYPEGGLGATRNTTFAGSVAVSMPNEKCVEAWVLINKQGIAYAVSGNPDGGTTVDPDPVPEVGPLKFTEQWNFSTTKGNLGDHGTTRNMAYNDGKLYVGRNGNSVAIIDAFTGQERGTLSNGSVVSGLNSLIGVNSFCGKIYGCNLVTSGTAAFRFYRWDSDSSLPVLVFSDASHSDVARLGDNFTMSGTENDYWVTLGSGSSIREYHVVNGALADSKTVASSVTMGISARAYRTASGYSVTGGSINITKLDGNGKATDEVLKDNVVSGNDFVEFDYNGKKYMFVTTYLNNSASSLADGVMRLYDVTDGWKSAKVCQDENGNSHFPAKGLGGTRNTAFSTAVAVARPNPGQVHAWVLSTGQGIAMYTSGKSTGIEDVIVEESAEDAPVEFYNLNGIRVSGENLAPGLYIRRQGNKATKVLVR